MANLNQILASSATPYKKLREENKKIVRKWEQSGLLEGLGEDRYERDNIAMLLENQARQLVNENSKTGTAQNSEEWNGVALPLVRRIFAEIAAKEFVSVQPMNLPSGLVFWLEHKYGTAQPGFTTGAGKNSQTDAIFGVTGEEAKDADPSGGLYGAGRFGYSINDTNSSALTLASTPSSTQFTTGSVSASDYNFDTRFYNQYSASLAANKIFKVIISSASLTTHDTEGIRAFKVSGSGYHAYFPQFTVANSTDSQITFIVSGSAAGVGSGSVVTYHKQPTDITRGDFEDTTGSDIGIPEINLELRSEPIVAKSRKLKAIWSPEFAQDLNAYHSIDAEAELTSMLSEYISQEIDFEILDMLIKAAQTTERWSARVGRVYDPLTTSFGDLTTAQAQASAYTQQTWFSTLGTKIRKVSNAIHQKTLRGGANFLVCSPQVATILESIPGYNVDTTGNQMQFAFGAQKVGAIDNQIQVYKNPYMLENQILMGYRGTQFLETGAVYAPYIPLVTTPLVYDPTNFTPRKGIMTRYAKKVVRPEFFGLIQIENLSDV